MDEGHIECDGLPIAGALVDFGLYFFHNIHVRMSRGSATYYYLPKMETYLECRLWNQVFQASEDYMQIPQGAVMSIKKICPKMMLVMLTLVPMSLGL